MGPAIVRDAFKAQDGAQILSHITQVVALAPLVAPMIGGYLLVTVGWRAIFVVLGGCGVAILTVTSLKFAESSRFRDVTATRLGTLLRNYGRFLSHRTCLGYMLVNCCVFAGLFSYISGSSFVFIEVFGVPSEIYGVLFGLTALAFMVGAAVNSRLVRRFPPQRLLSMGLVIVLVGGVSLVLCAIVVPAIATIMLPMMIFVFGMGLVLPNGTAAAMEPMPHMAGLASSLLGSSQMALGSLAGFLVNSFYDRTPIAMASGIGGAALCACLVYLLLIRGRKAAVT